MKEPKPLTKERMGEIATAYRSAIRDADADRLCHPLDPYRVVTDLLAAEAFWREAVKNADVCGEIGVPCPWCGARSYDQNIEASHRYGCEYLLAQEG